MGYGVWDLGYVEYGVCVMEYGVWSVGVAGMWLGVA